MQKKPLCPGTLSQISPGGTEPALAPMAGTHPPTHPAPCGAGGVILGGCREQGWERPFKCGPTTGLLPHYPAITD